MRRLLRQRDGRYAITEDVHQDLSRARALVIIRAELLGLGYTDEGATARAGHLLDAADRDAAGRTVDAEGAERRERDEARAALDRVVGGGAS